MKKLTMLIASVVLILSLAACSTSTTAEPSLDLGVTENGIVYTVDGSNWDLLVPMETIKGEQGEQGPAGIDGIDGVNGTNGVDGVDGTVDASTLGTILSGTLYSVATKSVALEIDPALLGASNVVQSAVVYGSYGPYSYAITNYVGTDSATYKIYTDAETSVPAALVEQIEELDLAVFQFVSTNVTVAEPAGAIANGGLLVLVDNSDLILFDSAELGILSSTERFVQLDGTNFVKVYQSDLGADGAIFTTDGKLLGIATGSGIMVPAETIEKVFDRMISATGFVKAVTGFTTLKMFDEVTGVTFNEDREDGVVITSVAVGSPAADKGIKANDILVSIDGIAIQNVNQFNDLMLSYQADNEITVTYIRTIDAEEFTFETILILE